MYEVYRWLAHDGTSPKIMDLGSYSNPNSGVAAATRQRAMLMLQEGTIRAASLSCVSFSYEEGWKTRQLESIVNEPPKITELNTKAKKVVVKKNLTATYATMVQTLSSTPLDSVAGPVFSADQF